MAGITATTVAIAAAAALALRTPAGTSTRYLPDTAGASSRTGLAVKDSANVSRNGMSVYWRIKVHCPDGQPFTLTAEIRQPVVLPPESAGLVAYYTATRGEHRGPCTGRTQAIGMRLTVTPTLVFAADGTSTGIILPLERSDTALVAKAYLRTVGDEERGYPYYCSYVPSETEDGTVCEDATQIGPLLRLK